MKKGRNKRNSRKIQNETSRRSRKQRLQARHRRPGGKVREAEKRDQITKDANYYRSLIMMVFALSSVGLLFLLYIFAFATKKPDMMDQIMTIVKVGLVSSMGWAGGHGLKHLIGRFHG